MSLNPLHLPLVDGENNQILCDVAYRVRGDQLDATLARIQQHYGDATRVLPLSGQSGGGGIFQQAAAEGDTVIGLQIAATPTPRVRQGENPDLLSIDLDEIVIDCANMRASAGAAITLDQLNLAVREHLGESCRVLGADLTSYTYAQVGATFMTGGMGPQRRYFSDSVEAALLNDGASQHLLSGEERLAYAGSYGWSGLITAVRCVCHQLPRNEMAFAIPVDNHPQKLAALLAALGDFCFLNIVDGSPATSRRTEGILLGLEHITVEAMQPMLASNIDPAILTRANQINRKCEDAEADGVIFVSGFTDLDVDDFLLALLDDADSPEPSIAGIALEHTELFKDPEQMRALRESVPFAARTQAPSGAFSFKGHTDAVIRINPVNVRAAMHQLWAANTEYVEAVNAVFDHASTVDGQLLVYGHLNPYGVDPHNRLTVASDDKHALEAVCEQLDQLRDRLIRTFAKICDDTGSTFVGGEKGAGSEQEMFGAFGGPEHAPKALREKFARQQVAIQAAPQIFRWRAMSPYV